MTSDSSSPASSTALPEQPAEQQRVQLIVLFGGQSAEHDVSCTTAAHVIAAVNQARYEVTAIGITREGRFVEAGGIAQLASAGQAGPAIEPLSTDGPEAALMSTVDQARAAGHDQTVVLPLLHGPLGEDGTVQGLCELAGVPYVGAGVLGSAVSMDKVMAKTILDQHGIPQSRWRAVHEREVADDPIALAKDLAADLGLPCFVKPANMGSSIGVTKALDEPAIIAALETAMRYDELAVVEEAVEAREIEISVLGNQNLELSVPGEIIPGAEFYDYEDKYLDGQAQLVIPADLPPEMVERLHGLAIEAYRALRVEGMARADFLYEENGRGPLVNELNTIPGFTPISMYPKLWEASGLAYPDLIDRLVDLALERHRRRSPKRTTARDPRVDS